MPAENAPGDGAARPAGGPTPTPDGERLLAELDDRDAAAFVHVGDPRDPTLRYCTRSATPWARSTGERSAIVVTRERTFLLMPTPPDAPAGALDVPSAGANRGASEGAASDDTVRTFDPAREHVGRAVARVLQESGAAGELVLAPAHVPHDAALYVEQAGYELASTDVVARLRERATDAERARIAAVQDAAGRALDRTREVLAAATSDGGGLAWNDEPLTAKRLRREANAALGRAGVVPAGNTLVATGRPFAGPEPRSPNADIPLEPGRPIVVSLAPRGPQGYHGALARTVVVDGDGGWERRAQLAIDRALEAACAKLAGEDVDAAAVREELRAEISAFGFGGGGAEIRVDAHGVGLEARERSRFVDGERVPEGAIVALRGQIADDERGVVALGDLFAVTADGCDRIGSAARSIVP